MTSKDIDQRLGFDINLTVNKSTFLGVIIEDKLSTCGHKNLLDQKDLLHTKLS